jgi:tungstate transport system permease protein
MQARAWKSSEGEGELDLIAEGIAEAFRLLIKGDREVLRIALLTLRVSGIATIISAGIGVPLGTALSLWSHRGRRRIAGFVNTGMGLPPVVVGLWVSIFLWRTGPLGFLRLMYTPTAMVIAQTVIALPIVTGFTMAGVGQLDPGIRLQMLSLGASSWQLLCVLIREARLSVLAAIMAGFGRVVAEVGASMMVGGNLLGQTRVLTTATSMEVSKGNFGFAIALSIILVGITYIINVSLTRIQQ